MVDARHGETHGASAQHSIVRLPAISHPLTPSPHDLTLGDRHLPYPASTTLHNPSHTAQAAGMVDTRHGEKRAVSALHSVTPPATVSYSLTLSSPNNRTPLVLSDHAHSSSHYRVDILNTPAGQSPLLLDAIPPIRSLIWQYMDNHSAWEYLGTCRHRRALYHSFPLTEPVSLQRLSAVHHIRKRLDPQYYPRFARIRWTLADCCIFALLATCIVPVLFIIGLKRLLVMLCCPRREDCCAKAKRLRRVGRVQPIPRVIRLEKWCHPPALPYLQHAEELRLADHPGEPVTKYKLPHSLRRMFVQLLPERVLSASWLPSGLTVLALSGGTDKVLQPGVLPQSLRTLIIERGDEESGEHYRKACLQLSTAGVLPPQMQHLAIQWNLPLTNLVLPVPLTRLDVCDIPNQPIPPNYLPAGLLSLRIITSSFDPHHLRGALPSSLQVLRLHCSLTNPVSASLLAQVPQLEVLDLGSRYPYRLTAGEPFAALTRLREMRVGLVVWQLIPAHELPASLRRLIVVVARSAPRPSLDELPMATLRSAVEVEYEHEPYASGRVDAEAIFTELCPANPSRRAVAVV